MSLVQRIRAALHAFTAPEPAPAAAPGALSSASVKPPAAFSLDPTFHASCVHVYEAYDGGPGERPYDALLKRATGVLKDLVDERSARAVAPHHLDLAHRYLRKLYPEGEIKLRPGRVVTPETDYLFTSTASWVEGELVLCVYSSLLPIFQHKPGSAGANTRHDDRIRWYITRLSLPHMQYKHLHTFHVDPPVKSGIDAGLATV